MEFRSEVIKSRQNKAVSELAGLTDRKQREASSCFRFDGIKLTQEAVKNGVELVTVFLRESTAEAVGKQLEALCGADFLSRAERVCLLSDDLFDRVSEEKSPEGVICTAKYIDKIKKNVTIYNGVEKINGFESVILLESVRDPSNVGAIVRSAAAIGIDRLIISADCADVYHPKAVRASMGTLFNQPIDVCPDLPNLIRQLRGQGRRVFAAALDENAERLGSFTPVRGDCVVIGNEGHGLSKEVLEACGRTVIIPMSGRAESFNAAVASSLLMWEFSKAYK